MLSPPRCRLLRLLPPLPRGSPPSPFPLGRRLGYILLLLLVLLAVSTLTSPARFAGASAADDSAAASTTTTATCESDDGTCSEDAVAGEEEGEGGDDDVKKSATTTTDPFAAWFDEGVKNVEKFFREEIFSFEKQKEEENAAAGGDDDIGGGAAAAGGDEVKGEEGGASDKKKEDFVGLFDRIREAFGDGGSGGGGAFFDDAAAAMGNGAGRDGDGKKNNAEEEEDGNGGSNGGDGDDNNDNSPLAGLASFWSNVFSSSSSRGADDVSVSDLIERARKFAGGDGGKDETRTLQETFDLFSSSLSMVTDALHRSFGHIDLGKLTLASLFYYLEYEDERKNPSWKRRGHRFHGNVDPGEVYELHEALWLAEISYVDKEEELRELLLNGGGRTEEEEEREGERYELVYSKMESAPNEPAHYIAIKREQPKYGNYLEVLFSVRGTKEFGDLLSDAFLDATDYRGGKAHAGIVASGVHLARKHADLLKRLLDASGRKRIKLLLVGHSLGAGAASIAAIEFNDGLGDFVDATAVGFGCPALLSTDLADSTKEYVLTVVADSDLVPRMSGATVENAVLDVMGHDWTKRALRDVRQLIDVVRANVPFEMPRDKDEGVLRFVNSTLDSVRRVLREIPTRRLSPELIPPGRCVHFFRDGSGTAGRHTPCDHFDSIDVTWTMIDDHLTGTGYHRLMLDFMRGHRRDWNFRFRREPLF